MVPQAVTEGTARDPPLHLLGVHAERREEPLLRHVGHHELRRGGAHLQDPEGCEDVERLEREARDLAGDQEQEPQGQAQEEGDADGEGEERPHDEAGSVQDALRRRLHGDLGNAHVPPVAQQEAGEGDGQRDAHNSRRQAAGPVAGDDRVQVARVGAADQPGAQEERHADHQAEADPHEAQAGVLQEDDVGEAERHRDRHREDGRPVVLQGVGHDQEEPDARVAVDHPLHRVLVRVRGRHAQLPCVRLGRVVVDEVHPFSARGALGLGA
mmetsp:Transcript_16827/g.52643  ORF Transcript_16827/g.52643 Transcript_16827/m.52643 type:complete len:269 (+) Transcript_16827:1016-1822(+)